MLEKIGEVGDDVTVVTTPAVSPSGSPKLAPKHGPKLSAGSLGLSAALSAADDVNLAMYNIIDIAGGKRFVKELLPTIEGLT